jgi:anti-sigma regulatory factor (Ser/Thr protein kinase)
MVQLADVTLPDPLGDSSEDSMAIGFHDIRIPSSQLPMALVRDEMLKVMTGLDYSSSALCTMQIAIAEALHNAMEHGNHFDPKKSIHISYQIDSKRIWVAIEDEGTGFDPTRLLAANQSESSTRFARHGLALIGQCCDEFYITPPGNRIELLKYNA